MNEKKTISIDISCKKNMWISLVFYFVVVFTNYASAMGLINGQSQSAVSKSYPTMITPAGFAFSIWGVIYLFIFIAIISPLFKNNEINGIKLNAIAKLFWLSAIINIAWTIVFSYEIIWLSAILILALLAIVFVIMKKLKTIDGNSNGFFDLGFGLYAGWLSIASIVNFMAYLVSSNFKFFNNPFVFYSVVLFVFVLVIAGVQKLHNNPFYVLSIIWAFFGIIVKQDFQSYTNSLFLVLVFGMILLLVVDVMISVRKMKFKI